jgi:hypothetical protein
MAESSTVVIVSGGGGGLGGGGLGGAAAPSAAKSSMRRDARARTSGAVPLVQKLSKAKMRAMLNPEACDLANRRIAVRKSVGFGRGFAARRAFSAL